MGIVLGIGFGIGKITHSVKLTRVVGYIMLGAILGPSFLGVPEMLGITEGVFQTIWDTITLVVLSLVAFIIGAQLTKKLIDELGTPLVVMIIGESLLAFFLVFLGTYLYTGQVAMALLLGGLAPASAPAGTVAVIHEYNAKGTLTDALLAIVGFDDALAIIIFIFGLAGAASILGGGFSVTNLVILPGKEIIGGLIVGSAAGGGLTLVEGKIKERDSLLVVSLSFIFFSAGLAEMLNFSVILSCMAIGIVFINTSPGRGESVRDIVEGVMAPLYVLFFVLVGMEMNFGLLTNIGLLAAIYVLLRIVGLAGGASLAAKLAKAPESLKYAGLGILSQAGVAIGLAAIARSRLAALAGGIQLTSIVLTVVLSTTIFFEIIGPIGTRYVLEAAGEIGEE